MDTRTSILFLCIENSNRSQMAEAFARKDGGDLLRVYSAGSAPGKQVNPRAVEMMHETGCSMSGHHPKGVSELPVAAFDFVISMGCGDHCPVVPNKSFEDWQVVDPKFLGDQDFRTVRDYIRIKVRDLISRIEAGGGPS